MIARASLCVALALASAACAAKRTVPERPGSDAIVGHEACVVLLHGLARSAGSMSELEHALQGAGYAVANIDYSSREHPIEQLAPEAVGRGLDGCRKHKPERIHFVTHSLGGILVRYQLAHGTVPELGRVVMLGPPNQGSEVVDTFGKVWGFDALNGPAGKQLGTDAASVPLRLGPVTYPVGIIAGTSTVNPILSSSIPGEDDGKVSVERAKLEGMADFITLPVSHPFLMRDDEVIRQTIAFLAHGKFDHE